MDKTSVVGGLQGLFRLDGNVWKKLDDRPVKDIAATEGQVWILYGDGSVDKIDTKTGRVYFDVLAAAAKRPWTSSLAVSGEKVLFGGHGGWVTKSTSGFTERYPTDISGDVVTCLAPTSSGVMVGTQKHGLYAVSAKKLMHFGFAKGLPDTWVTSMVATTGGAFAVGLAEAGVVELRKGRLRKLECPITRVRKVLMFRGRLVVGGMDGVVIQSASDWERLTDEECTCLTQTDGKLIVGTPGKTFLFR
ncbi:MAG: hypothetical protein ABL962_02255 [Fimbriimonadaceae bacterium]